MTYEVFLEKRVLKEIRSVPDKDLKRIKEALVMLQVFPGHLDVKKLVGTGNKYRIRVGEWRILIELDADRIVVFDILPRKKAYR